MSGKYLHEGFTLPCPPGLKIPEEDGYTITPNTLKVPELGLILGAGVSGGVSPWRDRQGGGKTGAPLCWLTLRALPLYVGKWFGVGEAVPSRRETF